MDRLIFTPMDDGVRNVPGGVELDEFHSRIDRLNLSNPSDAIWAYKNILQVYKHSALEFHRMVKMMTGHRLLDFTTCSIILDEIGGIIQDCFGHDVGDEEMMFVISRCGLDIKSKDHTPSIQCMDYFYRLVLPFARTCTKQVVDIVAFLFTRTTVGEFDEFFEIFRDKKDFLVELNLLKVRLMRERSIKYRCTRCRGEEPSPPESPLEIKDDETKGMDFYSMEDSNRNEMCKRERGPDDLNHSQDKPFSIEESMNNPTDDEIIKNINENDDEISTCISLLALNEQPNVNDPLDCDSTQPQQACSCQLDSDRNPRCLCGSYDSEDENHCLSESKRYLLEIESISPRFFLENASLYLSLSYDEDLFELFKTYTTTEYRTICASNVFRLKRISSDEMESIVDGMADMRREMLRSDDLMITQTTLKIYVDWCLNVFDSISISSINDYSEVSRLYIKFLRGFRHRRMFGILQGLCGSKIDRIMSMTGAHLVNDLNEMVELLLELFNGSMEDQRDDIQDIDDLLSRFDVPDDVERELERIITEVVRSHRKGFLSQIEVLNHFGDEFRSGVIEMLCTNYDTDWRYRKEVLCSYRRHPNLFGGRNILDGFINDPVFIVRRMALDVKEEESSSFD